ncbi:MAG: hypothetical protein M3T56_07320 [Chloroflexota bacterium]|nr:hypothetical protein [Chloroflexota bacterium]
MAGGLAGPIVMSEMSYSAPPQPETAQTVRFVPPWLPLLRRITEVSPDWLVWKNADLALAGDGDIDSAAPEREWPKIVPEFVTWAREFRLGPVAVCRHIGGGVELIAIPEEATAFVELGMKAKRFFRGSTLYRAEDFIPLAQLDTRGFRRLRPGAEGLMKLVLQGFRWSGAPNVRALREKQVLELIRSDPLGARAAARLFGVAEAAVVAAADAAASGRWDRRAVLTVQTRQLVRGLRDPGPLIRRARFKLAGGKPCAVTRAMFEDRRRIPDDRERWLALVRRDHQMYE